MTTWTELDVEAPGGEEERVVAALWECGTVGAWTVREGLVRGYFSGQGNDVAGRFRGAWRAVTGADWAGHLRTRPAPDRDWLARWRATVQPVEVAPELWVAPPGAETVGGPGARVVVIQPGQGFGTGTHPTTRALLGWLAAEPGERVLDVGCGSGVLGLASVTLGARAAFGLDLDADALANADENRRRNGLSRELRLVRGSVDAIGPAARFDRVLANLDRCALATLLGDLVDRCARGGRVGIAGLLDTEADELRARIADLPVSIRAERVDVDPATGDAWWSAWLGRDGR